ncbi:MAG: 2-hydroxyacid dehydrogenase [Planctomycetes bacterium]|nr:2-hydroxyacid dehydrogenase [Planctomycetota bacterium]
MKTLVFSSRPSHRDALETANRKFNQDLTFIEARLCSDTAALAKGYDAICIFVNDVADRDALDILAREGIKLIALRAAGYNNVDLRRAGDLNIAVSRVPAYSPHAVAEHAVALILSLNRKIARAYARVREGNFSLEGLMGFDMYGKTVGIIGTGKIGAITAGILHGFGCDILAQDPYRNAEVEKFATYVELDELLAKSDIVSLHCPLTPESYHLMNMKTLWLMKKGAMLINTSRGALVDATAAIAALKTGQLGYLGLDVYEEEADLFFEDLSDSILQDDLFARLLTFPNVLITAHQAFFTKTAMANIAETTLENISQFADDGKGKNLVLSESIRRVKKS